MRSPTDRPEGLCRPFSDCTLREDKNAVIYGGGGVIGGAVARGFGRTLVDSP